MPGKWAVKLKMPFLKEPTATEEFIWGLGRGSVCRHGEQFKMGSSPNPMPIYNRPLDGLLCLTCPRTIWQWRRSIKGTESDRGSGETGLSGNTQDAQFNVKFK